MNVYRVDLHVHTDASPDGRSGLPALAAAAKAAGLNAIAITDHDACTPVPEQVDGVLMIPGCEISTAAGHITGLFLEKPVDFAVLGHLPAPEAAVATIRASGGVAVIAHPFHRPGTEKTRFAFPVDGVETANARAAFKVADANEKAARLAAEQGLVPIGGSDAHDAKEVGNAYTELSARELTLPALKAALLAEASRPVLRRNTPHLRKGLSQWTKARRRGGLKPLLRAAAYVCYCLLLDILRR